MDPRKQTPGGRHQIGIPAGFKSESVAGFLLECVAGFIGNRTYGPGLRGRRLYPGAGSCFSLRVADGEWPVQRTKAWLNELDPS